MPLLISVNEVSIEGYMHSGKSYLYAKLGSSVTYHTEITHTAGLVIATKLQIAEVFCH